MLLSISASVALDKSLCKVSVKKDQGLEIKEARRGPHSPKTQVRMKTLASRLDIQTQAAAPISQ